MNLSTRARRLATITLVTCLCGPALAIVPASAAGPLSGDRSAGATAGPSGPAEPTPPARAGSRQVRKKATIRYAAAYSGLDSQTRKMSTGLLGEAKIRLPLPKSRRSGYVSGTLTARIGGKKALGSISPAWSSTKNRHVLNQPATFALLSGVPKRPVGKRLKLVSFSWAFYRKDGTHEVRTVKVKADPIRIRPSIDAGVFHFPRAKVLTIRSYKPIFNQKRLRRIDRKWRQAQARGRNRYLQGSQGVGGLVLTVQRAKNKKRTRWKTVGRVRLDRHGWGRLSRGIKKGGSYRVRFAGNPRYPEFDAWSDSWSGKPARSGYPKPTATSLDGASRSPVISRR